MEQLYNLLRLSLVPGVGDILARNLIGYCGGVSEVFGKKTAYLAKIPGVGKATAESIVSFDDRERIQTEIDYITKHNIQVISYLDEAYPKRLSSCPDAPLLLYYKGNADMNKGPAVAIVGTRHATDYGKRICAEIVEGLRHLDPLVVSGLAYGIDIAVHKHALKSHLRTIGVMAHGLDRIYPGMHASTSIEMLEQGGLLTEFMTGTNPDRENFPRRNRIVAGMVDCVIVVESAKKGGALITANIANSYNRDVFAVPGRIGDKYAEGCHQLLHWLKADIYTSVNDVITQMGWDDKKVKPIVQKELLIDLTDEERKIMDLLKASGPTGIDRITQTSGMNLSAVAAALLNLEFRSVVRSLPGKIYELT